MLRAQQMQHRELPSAPRAVLDAWLMLWDSPSFSNIKAILSTIKIPHPLHFQQKGGGPKAGPAAAELPSPAESALAQREQPAPSESPARCRECRPGSHRSHRSG